MAEYIRNQYHVLRERINESHKFMQVLTVVFIALIVCTGTLASCSNDTEEKAFSINGVWEMQQVTFPDGEKLTYTDRGRMWMRIYDDSCYYTCQTEKAPNGTMIAPADFETYRFVRKGKSDVFYLQGGNAYPLWIVNDSTMVIQEDGVKYTWRQNHDIEDDRCRDIIGIIRMDRSSVDNTDCRYVFSKAEKKLETTNHALVYMLMIIGMVLVLIVNYAYNLYRNKKRVEQELRQIEEERKSIPEPVRQALSTVETEFHKSDFYISLRKSIANGDRLRKEDWEAIESHLNGVYPRFTSTLLSLHNMSPVEYHVCLLLKLNATPSEIAGVLCKDASSISSTRSRLYQKVFGKKGSSKDWDEFILSL